MALAKDRLTSDIVALKVMRKAQVHWEQLACARREPGALLEMGHESKWFGSTNAEQDPLCAG